MPVFQPRDGPQILLSPTATSTTILGHLLSTGKRRSGNAQQGEVVIVDRPLQRAHELYLSGHAHDVLVCCEGMQIFVTSKCWATQKKNKKEYEQKLVLNETTDKEYCTVKYARCIRCVAGGDGGLCFYVFAVLEAQF